MVLFSLICETTWEMEQLMPKWSTLFLYANNCNYYCVLVFILLFPSEQIFRELRCWALLIGRFGNYVNLQGVCEKAKVSYMQYAHFLRATNEHRWTWEGSVTAPASVLGVIFVVFTYLRLHIEGNEEDVLSLFKADQRSCVSSAFCNRSLNTVQVWWLKEL